MEHINNKYRHTFTALILLALWQPCAIAASLDSGINSEKFAGNFTAPTGISYQQAMQRLQDSSYALKAADANTRASAQQAQASSHLWSPIINLDARAIKYRTEVEVPLGNVKNAGENLANQAFGSAVDQLPVPLPDDVASQIKDRFSSSLSGFLDRVPNSQNLVIEDSLFRPSISMVMPLYAGGSIQAAQNMAQLAYQKSLLNHEQLTQHQTPILVEAYFGQQLALRLKQLSSQHLMGLQQHVSNALKLQQQGMISKSQRLQAEVAMQSAQRQYDQAAANELSSRYRLQQLLQQQDVNNLATPLFVNAQPLQPLDTYLSSLQQQSPQLQQFNKDKQLAEQAATIAKAQLLPNAYAFGQQTLNKSDWMIGIGARYTLLSNTDRQKTLHAAQARVQAVDNLKLQAQQDIQQLIIRAYYEADAARKAFLSMQKDIESAGENLRIQQISFKEGESTATFVNDALTALTLTYTDQATAAYRYDIALATLLTASGMAPQFEQFLTQSDLRIIAP